MANRIKIHAGQVYFNPHAHGFVEVRSITHGTVHTGWYSSFYDDARTNIGRMVIPRRQFKAMKLVRNIEQFPYARRVDLTILPQFPHYAWRARGPLYGDTIWRYGQHGWRD